MADKQIRHQQIGYIRVSSADQNTVRQLDNMELDVEFTDKCSGSTIKRPELKRLIEYARAVDTVHVHSIDRMARNLGDLIEIVRTLNDKGVSVKFYQENLLFAADNSNPMSELMLNLLGAVYQFERAMILERQRQGIAQAKADGKYKGRPRNIDKPLIIGYLSEGMSISKTAKLAKCGSATVQRVKKEHYDQIERDKLLHQQKTINDAVAAIAA
jgi:DNA invertase Pin-like site-specific DNA recombinase